MRALRVAAAGLGPESRGILGIALAMLLFTVMDAIAKDLMARNDPVIVIWARFAGQMLLVCIVFAPRLGTHLRSARPMLQLWRSVLHLVANVLFFTALSMIALAEAVAVFQVAPLLITVFAVLILSERVGPRRWLAVVAGLGGALIIIRPGLEVFQPAAVLPLGAAVAMALFQIIQRLIGDADTIETSILYTGIAGTAVMSAVVPFYWQTPSLWDAVLLTTFGWIGFLGHICLIRALTLASAATLAPYNYTGFVWALVIGLVVFAELPDAMTLLGAGVILGAGLYVWHRERVRAVRATEPPPRG